MGQGEPWGGIPVTAHLFLFSPLIALVCTMLSVVVWPLIVGRDARQIAGTVAIGLAIALLLAIFVARHVAEDAVSGLTPRPAAGMLIADNLSIGFQIVLLVFLGAITWLWWMGSASSERNAPEFFILLLGSAFGMALMAGTANLLMIVIAIETASLPSYAIVGFDKRDRVGAEASLKYVIFGAVCAAIMLYGASLLYGLVGSLAVADVARYTAAHIAAGENRILLAVALLCFLAGIAFKISAVPFHFWCPDVFQGAKIEITTWLSVASKAAGLVLLIRLVMMTTAAADSPITLALLAPLAWVIGIMAAVTCTVGNFAAFKQTSVKRLLAYSSIAHAGYMMMAAAVFVHPSAAVYEAALTALLVYIVVYLFMNLGAFGVTAFVAWETGRDHIDSFTGLWRRSPALALPMIVCLISLVGIPPLAGFLGKWWVLMALGGLHRESTHTGLFSFSSLAWFLIFMLAINTLVSLYYYLRIIVTMVLHEDGQAAVRPPMSGYILVNLCGAALLVLFLLAQPLKTTAERFSQNIYHTAAAEREAPVAAAPDR